jgi:hypothetical protein
MMIFTIIMDYRVAQTKFYVIALKQKELRFVDIQAIQCIFNNFNWMVSNFFGFVSIFDIEKHLAGTLCRPNGTVCRPVAHRKCPSHPSQNPQICERPIAHHTYPIAMGTQKKSAISDTCEESL